MTDESGTRAFTMVFTGDTAAWAVDRDGNDLYPVSALIARATEFPTPESMPAALPPSSAFTCCAELSADGLTGIRFDRPVVTWVDSFLGFETGMRVPAGYYDRNKGTWTASEDGFVVRLLDTDNNGITDALDRDGDGQPDDLDGDGSFSDEVKGLDDPGKYAPGSTFWRVEVTHFTPWDYNLSAGPPEGAVAPNFKSKGVVDMQISGDSATSLIEPCAEKNSHGTEKTAWET